MYSEYWLVCVFYDGTYGPEPCMYSSTMMSKNAKESIDDNEQQQDHKSNQSITGLFPDNDHETILFLFPKFSFAP